MEKILIIGQAPPAVKQGVPYETTLLYEMLSWVGVSKEQAQEIFEFEAMTNKFPGFGTRGHALPHISDMRRYYETTLEAKMIPERKVLVLGNVAKDALEEVGAYNNTTCKFTFLVHPSRRNYVRIMANRESIAKELKRMLA